MISLKGITWDHPRGSQPLRAVAETWNEQTGNELTWDVRTVKEFGDFPIENLIALYDFIIIDHPYMGESAANKLLVPLDMFLEREFIELQEQQSVGPGCSSYRYNGHYWALPVDAAAQVSAFRKDITDVTGWVLPKDIMQLGEAALQLPERYKIGIPLCPTDVWCVFLSLCAQYSNGNVFIKGGIDLATGEWALEQIRSWKTFLYKDSFSMNPIQMLEHMSTEDEIVYIPFTFGYTNYARRGWRPRLVNFSNVPKYTAEGSSSILGGAGLAISAKTKHLEACLDFTRLVLSTDIQKGAYYQNGGQPAHLAAWLDKTNNENCAGFFSDTIDTMNNAFVRPRPHGFNRFQEQAADFIHIQIQGNESVTKIIQELNTLYQTIVNETL